MSDKNIGEILQECCRNNRNCDLCPFRFICGFYAGADDAIPAQWGVVDCENFTYSFNTLALCYLSKV